ncbi:ShlB/FhaC/HecB family hemolysin secretion/activation protein [Corticibacter populi]|uniref:ShlB/FhaC/HecB family hemolysin secretion/activation protein n=2 Tax=Corticibacter populi TaxID=1550736 RepID=A0A3M6QNL0_9BURK|nr:ShlB/FhaC/HecB family hemolysin secretion/activation protein [Corticibacter populi]
MQVPGAAAGAPACLRPQADCAAAGQARQLELIRDAQQDEGDAARVRAGAVPGPQDPAAAEVTLRGVRFAGVAALPAAPLQRLAQPYIGQRVSLAQLEELAAQVAAHYRAQGYFLAQAFVPVQTIREGQVEISVIEGRLGHIRLELAEDAPIAEPRLRAMLAGLVPGQALRAQDYERAMLLLSDQPGIAVSSGLQAGAQPGTTDLVLEVAADRRVRVAADVDNHGVRESGRVRAGGTLRIASPLGLGDNLDARLMLSEGNALNFGRLAWEAPLGASGLRAGVGLARSRYELGGAYAALGAQGVARVVDVSLNYPLIRQRAQNLFLRAAADVKHLRDEMGALDYTARKRIHGVSLGWTWERRDAWGGGGYWASTGTAYLGRLRIRDALTALLDRPPAGRDTQGRFAKLGWQLSRLQVLAPRQLLYASVSGQFASGNLDAAERISLGGPRAVRAYASGEVLVDRGQVATLEWRWAATEELTPFVFGDAARGDLARRPTAFEGPVRRSLRGAGVGLVWSRPGDFSLTSTLAWRLNSPPGQTDGGDRKPRWYVQLQKVF